MVRRLPIAFILATLALAGCDRDAIYEEESFSDAIYDAYAGCNEGEIRWLTSKHNIQTIFRKCGSNNFVDFRWSPNGIHMYFELPLAAHVINGEEKTIQGIPTERPITNAAWLGDSLLVLPLGPDEGQEKNRLALWDRSKNRLSTMPLELEEPRDLNSAGDGQAVLLTAAVEGGRGAFRADLVQKSVTPIFPWLPTNIETFTYTPDLDLVTWGVGNTVRVARGDGEVLHHFENATRGSAHSGGRYIALETLGEPISPFDQRTWDELSPEQREREQRKTEEWLARQADWVPKEVRPPTLDIYDTETSTRYRITSFYGDHFEWYPNRDYFCSFVLWGVEGKELNKNVGLTNLADRLRGAAAGEEVMGIELAPLPEIENAEKESAEKQVEN